jgi:hypothetical protein
LTVWRSLRIVGAFGLRLSSGEMTLTVGDDTKTTYTFSRWRPVFALGLEVAL